ncbi:iojap-like protein [Clostridium sp. ATCC 29733]|nr:iojap-like protein [Clostridium sp. ATCC 29733]
MKREQRMTAREIAALAVQALEDKKAGDIKALDISTVSTLGDYFVLCEGTSTTQVKALADQVDFFLGQNGVEPDRIEGYQSAGWIVLDYGDVIVHVFHKESREFYGLERLWADGKPVAIDELKK